MVPEALQPWEWEWECNESESELLACHVSFLCIPSSSCFPVLPLPLFYFYIPYIAAPPTRCCSIIFLSDRTNTLPPPRALYMHSLPFRPANTILYRHLESPLIFYAGGPRPPSLCLDCTLLSSRSWHALSLHVTCPIHLFYLDLTRYGPICPPSALSLLRTFTAPFLYDLFPSRDWIGFGLDFLCLCVFCSLLVWLFTS